MQDSAARPYLHLIDGGVSDNVAMRVIVELLETVDVSRRVEAMPLLRDVRGIAIIIVNAVTSPNVDWGQTNLLNDIILRWSLERRLAVAEARLAGKRELAEELSTPSVDLYAIDVSFRDIADPEERRFYENLPTSFVLSPEAVDGLRKVAGRVLHASLAYRRLVQALGGTVAGSSTAVSQ